MCEDDEFELDNQIFSLDYRSIDGDVSLPQNSFKTPEFTPHGQYIIFTFSIVVLYCIVVQYLVL